MKAPALFISHGAPTWALEPGKLGPQLEAVGRRLERIKAALVISPHWQTLGAVRVMQTVQPETIHDFGGFEKALYEIQYPAPGAPELAGETTERLRAEGFSVTPDSDRGLDHGAWVPLRYLFPRATTPVFQVSLPAKLDTAGARSLGAALAPLRDCGVAVIGSGSMTHNLSEYFGKTPETDYAREFAEWVNAAIERRDVDALLKYRQLAPHARRAHPTEEHYLPLLVALGAAGKDERITYLEGGLDHGILSMDSYAWGLEEGAVL